MEIPTIDVNFFADESGQLHTNSKTKYFVIGGYFCLAEKSKRINTLFKRAMFKIKKARNMTSVDELKTREMTQNEKIKLLSTLQKADGFNGFALVVNKDKLKRKVTKESIYYNYFINIIMQDILFLKINNNFPVGEINVNMMLDNRNVSVGHLKGLEDYLNSEYVMSRYSFKTSYMNSSQDYRIQACDLIANTIYESFKEPEVVRDVMKIIDYKRIVTICFPEHKYIKNK